MPEGAPPIDKTVSLPHRWDADFPDRGGRALYRLALPAMAGHQDLGLYIGRAGNQVEVRSGSELLAQQGDIGDGAFDATRAPMYVRIPRAAASGPGPIRVDVLVSAQAQRWGGLGHVAYGPAVEAKREWRIHDALRVHLAIGVAVTMGTLALLAAGMARIQGDTVLKWLAASAALGAVNYASLAWSTPPLPWPYWGVLTKSVILPHWLLLQLALVELAGARRERIRQLTYVTCALGAIAPLASFTTGASVIWTAALILSVAFSAAVAVFTLAQACTSRRDRASVVPALVLFLEFACAAIDVINVRLLGDGPGTILITPVGTAAMMVAICVLLIKRHARQVQQYRGLLVSLDKKVTAKEAELRQQYERMQQEHAEKAVLLDRQRLMREIHDGVGSQLVALIGLLQGRRADVPMLREHAGAALDELRIAVDSLQPLEGNLATVLASLRYRLQARLEAAGVEVVWDVGDLPSMAHLEPATAIHIQRIFLEAFTNVLRHSGASQVRVSARRLEDHDGRIQLSVEDDGRGLCPRRSSRGVGLRSMHERARAIGATLRVEPAPGRGTRVALDMTLSG